MSNRVEKLHFLLGVIGYVFWALFFYLILFLDTGYARDIKEQVIRETRINEEINLFCIQFCKGNERRGYLKSLNVDKIDGGYYRVIGKAAFQNRYVLRDPFYFVLYDHTVVVSAFGTLNPDNCELRVDDVVVENDFHNIFSTMLRNHGDIIGRVERIDNCQKFLK
ncbi:MAG: hypothetical protein KatS3mg078_0065 [Deltaproteobacteria bacterium]|nr:MAG: hypothetical protein KatS3mg078_0065 [Deltaproteobacteria bacterium]